MPVRILNKILMYDNQVQARVHEDTGVWMNVKVLFSITVDSDLDILLSCGLSEQAQDITGISFVHLNSGSLLAG